MNVPLLILAVGPLLTGGRAPDAAPVVSDDQQQVPRAMHAQMKELPRINVGVREGDLRGADNRVLQAAVDYIAKLGGGIVEIGPGEYQMRDALHLRPHVTVRGQGAQTVLHKARAHASPLALDGDYGEEQVTLVNPTGFEVGDGVAVWDKNSGGFHTTVARITGKNGNTFSISLPLNADCMMEGGAQAATAFPIVSGYHVEGVRVEDLTLDGNKDENVHLNGCRGGGIFLYRCPGAVVERCTVRRYAGDGISFQQCNDVTVLGCLSEDNASLGIHPGSGSQRPTVRRCIARRNGEDGLFLCWRVKHGLFEDNLLEGNGRCGISIGHKDTDNLVRNNQVRGNHRDGVYFRDESEGMAGHRNRLEGNVIESNGVEQAATGIRVRGQTGGLVFKDNVIRDTRQAGERKQRVGIRLEERVRDVRLEGNRIDAATPLEDKRKR
jgi:hypothetical protein